MLREQKQKELLFFLTVATFFVYPIIHANIYFADDFFRVVTGSSIWESLGRPLATITQTIIAGGSVGILDIAPLTQLLTIIALAFSAFVFNEYIKRDYGKSLIFASVLLALNPYSLNNIIYRYDSLSMSLALFLSVYAFTLTTSDKKLFVAVPILIASLSFYQPSTNLFIALIGIELILVTDKHDITSAIRKALVRITQYCLAVVIYSLTIVQLSQKSRSRGALVNLDWDLPSSLADNFYRFFQVASKILDPTVLYFSFIFCCYVTFVVSRNFKTKDQKPSLFLSLIIALPFYLLSLSGPLVLLDTTVTTHRVISSIYALPMIFMVFCSCFTNRHSLPWLIPTVLSISLSFQFGNAARNQRDYERNIFQQIQSDLLRTQLDKKPIDVIGAIDRAPHAKRITEAHSFIDEIVKPASGWVAASILIELGMKETQFLWSGQLNRQLPSMRGEICDNHVTKTITENSLYSIYTNKEKTYILLSTHRGSFCVEPD